MDLGEKGVIKEIEAKLLYIVHLIPFIPAARAASPLTGRMPHNQVGGGSRQAEEMPDSARQYFIIKSSRQPLATPSHPKRRCVTWLIFLKVLWLRRSTDFDWYAASWGRQTFFGGFVLVFAINQQSTSVWHITIVRIKTERVPSL